MAERTGAAQVDLSGKTDAELLEAYCGGQSPESFEEIYRRYGRMVYGTCLRRLGSASEAEDAAAAAFMVLVRKAGKLARSRQSLAGWLQWCAINCARKAAWLRSRQMDRERKAAEMRDQLRDEDRTKWRAALPHLDDALASLPASQRDVVVQHYMLGRTLASIAAESSCPEGTVAGRARLGLEKLRRKLVRHGPALSAAIIGAGMGECLAGVSLPAGLTAKISAIAGGGAAAAAVGSSAAAISQATVKAMLWVKFKVAAVVVCGAAAVTGGGAAAVRTLLVPGPNRNILNMPDNSWLKLDPPEEARGRAYCGASLGGGYFWYFGGGKHTYLANDVNLFDVRRNRWIRATEPEQPERGSKNWNSMTDTGGFTYNLAPSGNPYAEQTHQQVCWVPHRKRFFVLLVSSGTWEFDPATRRWHHLVNRYENKEAEPRGSWGQNTVLYDPDLGAPIHCISSGPDRYVRVFDHDEMAWRKLGTFDGIRELTTWYSTWVPQWNAHLIMSRGQDEVRFHKFSAVELKLAPIETPPGMGKAGSLACDTRSGAVVVLEPEKLDRPWSLDVGSMQWRQLTVPGPVPLEGGAWNVLHYDPDHDAFIFLNFLGNEGKFVGGPSEIWAYRYERAAPKPESE
jgi:RNA polymerase sigma-70 factor (ECF subfamily)